MPNLEESEIPINMADIKKTMIERYFPFLFITKDQLDQDTRKNKERIPLDMTTIALWSDQLDETHKDSTIMGIQIFEICNLPNRPKPRKYSTIIRYRIVYEKECIRYTGWHSFVITPKRFEMLKCYAAKNKLCEIGEEYSQAVYR